MVRMAAAAGTTESDRAASETTDAASGEVTCNSAPPAGPEDLASTPLTGLGPARTFLATCADRPLAQREPCAVAEPGPPGGNDGHHPQDEKDARPIDDWRSFREPGQRRSARVHLAFVRVKYSRQSGGNRLRLSSHEPLPSNRLYLEAVRRQLSAKLADQKEPRARQERPRELAR